MGCNGATEGANEGLEGLKVGSTVGRDGRSVGEVLGFSAVGLAVGLLAMRVVGCGEGRRLTVLNGCLDGLWVGD